MLRPRPSWIVPGIAVAAAAAVVALYVWRAVVVGGAFGFPLDDAYIYMTYAKQMARFAPFTYFDGSGFSAGATSVLWPALLAPLWALGLRGERFEIGVMAVCAALLVATALLVVDLARRVTGSRLAALLPLALVLGSGTVTWNYLSGMEAPLAGTLILAVAARLLHEGEAPPSRTLLVLLAATALARPEAGLLVAATCGLRAAAALLGRRLRVAGLWLVPLAAPLALAVADQLLAGHFTPNTAVAKSHMYLPGFDWAYFFATTKAETGRLLDALFWSGRRGFVWAPKLLLALSVVGAVRVIVWGARERRLAGALFLVGAAPLIFAAVLVASGQWAFHNHRYIASGLPALFVVAGLALAPLRRWPRATLVPGALLAAVAAWLARDGMHYGSMLFAQGARDVDAQVVTIGKWIDAHLPKDVHLAVHDVGAIGYFGQRRMTDVLGLITNRQAEIANEGPGSRFEWLERLRPEERPTHFVYYPGWLLTGSRDLFGKELFAASSKAPVFDVALAGGARMVVFEARWDVLGSGEAPLNGGGWRVVDRIDVADQPSERAHRWRADLGRRSLNTPTAQWSQYLSEERGGRRVADGGRTVRGGERFAIVADPARPVWLLLRTGGPPGMAGSSVPDRPRTLRVAGMRVDLPAPSASFVEAAVELPAGTREVAVVAEDGAPYRVFHWFVLQQ